MMNRTSLVLCAALVGLVMTDLAEGRCCRRRCRSACYAPCASYASSGCDGANYVSPQNASGAPGGVMPQNGQSPPPAPNTMNQVPAPSPSSTTEGPRPAQKRAEK